MATCGKSFRSLASMALLTARDYAMHERFLHGQSKRRVASRFRPSTLSVLRYFGASHSRPACLHCSEKWKTVRPSNCASRLSKTWRGRMTRIWLQNSRVTSPELISIRSPATWRNMGRALPILRHGNVFARPWALILNCQKMSSPLRFFWAMNLRFSRRWSRL